MLSVELYQAFYMLPSRSLEEATGALTQVVVHHDRLRVVDDFPSGLFQGKAQVDILNIQEKAFIHDLVLPQGFPSEHHTGS